MKAIILTIVGASSLLAYFYGVYCILREIILIDKKSILKSSQKNLHFSLLSYNFVFWIILFGCMITGSSEPAEFKKHLISESGWFFLLICSQVMTSLTRYFRKLRLGQDFKLSYKEEFKRRVEWSFTENNDFDKVVKDFIGKNGTLNDDVYYLTNTTDGIENLMKLSIGEVIDFGSETRLEKYGGDKYVHDYLYHNDKPLVFGVHSHKEFTEIITPMKDSVDFYLFKNGSYTKDTINVGESYCIAKDIDHAAIFSKPNTIRLQWVY